MPLRDRAVRARAIAGLVAALCVAPALVAAGTTSAQAVDAGPVLRIGTTTAIDNPNIWAVTSTSEWEAVALQYDLMLKFGDEDLTAAPSLATGCVPSEGSRVWTCAIRSGVKWSDGKPLTSRDIAFSYRFVLEKQFDVFSTYFSASPTFETPNYQTLIWRTKEPTNGPTVPAWSYIVPEHVWAPLRSKDVKEITSYDPLPNVTSGPYFMSAASPGQNWTFTRNPNFWGPQPKFSTVVFQLFTNQDALVQALKNGQIDMVDQVSGDLIPALSKMSDVAIQKATSDYWINLAFNFGGQGPSSKPLPALQDLTVRKAIAMAIDKQKLVDKVYPGTAAPGETVIRPLSTFWHLDIPDDQVVKPDAAGANAMLDAAGYVRGDDGIRLDPKNNQPLRLRVPVSDDTLGSKAAGQLVAGFLKGIGIAVDVLPVTAAKMSDLQQSGDFDAYIWYWSGDPDPDYQLSVFSSEQCKNLSDGCFKDPAYDALFAAQRRTLDPAARQKIVKEAQQYLYDKVPGIVLAYPNSIQAYRTDKVAGLTPVPGKDGYIVPQYSYASLVSAYPPSASPAPSAAPSGSASGAASASPNATSPTTVATDATSSSGVPVLVWIGVAAAIALGLFAFARGRGRARDERE